MAGDDVPRKKPDPIIYQLAAQRVGLPPDRFLTSFWPVFDQPLLDQLDRYLTSIWPFGPAFHRIFDHFRRRARRKWSNRRPSKARAGRGPAHGRPAAAKDRLRHGRAENRPARFDSHSDRYSTAV